MQCKPPDEAFSVWKNLVSWRGPLRHRNINAIHQMLLLWGY